MFLLKSVEGGYLSGLVYKKRYESNVLTCVKPAVDNLFLTLLLLPAFCVPNSTNCYLCKCSSLLLSLDTDVRGKAL